LILDEKDIAILDTLQGDARLANADLSDRVGMSASSCWRKTKSLEEAGIIKRYTAVLDPIKMGLNFEALVHINLHRHDEWGVRSLTEELKKCPEVVECLAATGEYDYYLRVICTDIEAYNHFMEKTLFRNKSVQSMKTNVVLKHIKSNAPISAGSVAK